MDFKIEEVRQTLHPGDAVLEHRVLNTFVIVFLSKHHSEFPCHILYENIEFITLCSSRALESVDVVVLLYRVEWT
jgi:hypothetical protein